MSEDKIQHTDALNLCAQLTGLHQLISGLQHELVLHYSATGAPAHKTKGAVESVSRKMDTVEEHLDAIRAELDELER